LKEKKGKIKPGQNIRTVSLRSTNQGSIYPRALTQHWYLLFTRVGQVLQICTKPPLGIRVDNHGYKNQILGNGYITMGIKISNKLLLFITMFLKKLGKKSNIGLK
jgi:hypothetical protein